MYKLACAVLAMCGGLVQPALAIDPQQTSVTCTGAVTTGLGGNQSLRDLDPSDLPVIAYADTPGDRQFKQLARFGDVPIRLYVYRVNDKLLHMQIYEADAAGKGVLADMPLAGEMSELTYRSIGGSEMVTVYCY